MRTRFGASAFIAVLLLLVNCETPAFSQPAQPNTDAPIAALSDLGRLRCDALASEVSRLYMHYNFCIPNPFYRRRFQQASNCSNDFSRFQSVLRPLDRQKWDEIRRISVRKRCPS